MKSWDLRRSAGLGDLDGDGQVGIRPCRPMALGFPSVELGIVSVTANGSWRQSTPQIMRMDGG